MTDDIIITQILNKITALEQRLDRQVNHEISVAAGGPINADTLDTYHAGNLTGQVPVSNGVVNTDLNADLLDGQHAGNATGQIPLSNAILNVNLNADLLDGLNAANANGRIPINNGTLNSNLNADMLDGVHAGNATGQVPLSNGTVNTNLNADMVDGYHAGNASGQVPLSNAVGNVNLNADMLDGLHYGSFFQNIFSQVVAGGDFNNALTQGDWYVASNTSITNAPFTGAIYGKLHVYVSDGTTHNNSSNWIWQHFDSTDGRIFMRYKVNAGVWQAWSPVFTNQTIYYSGAWPANPVFGQVVFRTDLGWWMAYNGSIWITVNEFSVQSTNYVAAGGATVWIARLRTQYAPYITRIAISQMVATTNNGTNYWTITVRGVNLGYTSATNIHSINTSLDAANTTYDKEAAPNVAAIPAAPNNVNVDFSVGKVGAPGNLTLYGTIYYRMIVP